MKSGKVSLEDKLGKHVTRTNNRPPYPSKIVPREADTRQLTNHQIVRKIVGEWIIAQPLLQMF